MSIVSQSGIIDAGKLKEPWVLQVLSDEEIQRIQPCTAMAWIAAIPFGLLPPEFYRDLLIFTRDQMRLRIASEYPDVKNPA